LTSISILGYAYSVELALGIVIALTLLAQADDDRMKPISGVGTNRTSRAGLAMSVDWGRPEVTD
jgi:hypothetical protein